MSVIRRSILLVAMFATLWSMQPMPAFAQKAQPQDIVGIWQAEDKHLKLEMFNVGNEYSAKLLFGRKLVEQDGVTFKQDVNNPDPALRSRSLKEIVFVKGLSWQNGRWSGGTIYDATSGKTYSCQVDLVDGKLRLKGYLGVPMLGETIVLVRVDAPKS